jgi:nitrate/TMAO reductase-like tetraheme cytochrome c subunit
MSLSKSVKWTLNANFFKRSEQTNIFVSINGKTFCLICNENIAVLKEYNIARHYNSKYKEKYKNCIVALRRQKSGGFIKVA